MYTMIRQLNTDSVNLVTLEDPVEYNIDGVNQVQINEKTGMTFASGLRAILRQDPDIVAVGEVRDGETARSPCAPPSPATWCCPPCTPTTRRPPS